jgi:hypothetical protein
MRDRKWGNIEVEERRKGKKMGQLPGKYVLMEEAGSMAKDTISGKTA